MLRDVGWTRNKFSLHLLFAFAPAYICDICNHEILAVGEKGVCVYRMVNEFIANVLVCSNMHWA